MKRILNMFLAGATAALAACGSSTDESEGHEGLVGEAEQEIVGGYEATPHSSPWQAAITIDGSSFCGGVIIGDEWVLTAAHCLHLASSVEVTVGAHDRTQVEPTQVTQVSQDLTIHQQYGSALIRNDIGLIRLPQPLVFDDYIQPIALDGVGEPPPGTTATMTGWGRTSDSVFTISTVLIEADAPILSNEQCEAAYGSLVTAGNICIDTAGGHGTCNGDSGGPLVWNDSLVGIVSFGSSAGCQAGYPGAFSRISYFREWIQQNSGI